jgi:hypothetical protein
VTARGRLLGAKEQHRDLHEMTDLVDGCPKE